MSRRSRQPSDRSPEAAREASIARARQSATTFVTAAVALAAAGIAFSGALPYFFSTDDFRWLATARGLVPPPESLTRWIPYRLFWGAMSATFGLHPWPYHLSSLLAHLAATAAVFALARRWMTAPAAMVAASFYGTHAALFDSVYWISAIGDPLATALALFTIERAASAGRARWFALPAFAAALACKESVALLPLATWCVATPGRPSLRDPLRWILTAVAALAVAALAMTDTLGLRSGASHAYATAFGSNLIENLLTYAGWSLNAFLPTVRSFSDAVDPGAYGWGVAMLLIAAAGFALKSLRARGWAAGVAVFVLGIAPVLPLVRHTYHYYLSAALAGAALLLGAALDAGFARGGRRVAFALGGALVILLALNGAALVRKIERFPFPIEGLRANSIVDRARIARNVIGELRDAGLPAGASLVLWSPTSRRIELLEDGDPRWSYAERNVRAALYEGLGIRIFFPGLAGVRFTTRFEPASDSTWYGVYRPDGHLRAGPATDLARALGR